MMSIELIKIKNSKNSEFKFLIFKTKTKLFQNFNETTHWSFPLASFLTTICPRKLADLNQDRYPESSRIIRHDFYMDDLLTGTNTIELAK